MIAFVCVSVMCFLLVMAYSVLVAVVVDTLVWISLLTDHLFKLLAASDS